MMFSLEAAQFGQHWSVIISWDELLVILCPIVAKSPENFNIQQLMHECIVIDECHFLRAECYQ